MDTNYLLAAMEGVTFKVKAMVRTRARKQTPDFLNIADLLVDGMLIAFRTPRKTKKIHLPGAVFLLVAIDVDSGCLPVLPVASRCARACPGVKTERPNNKYKIIKCQNFH